MSPTEPRRLNRAGNFGGTLVPEEAARVTIPEDAQAERRHLHLVRQEGRKRASRRHLLVSLVIAALAAVAMGLVALHVLIAENQFRLDNLQQQANTQQESYEKLRLSVAQLEAPARIVSVAEGRLGMQPPGSVTYLPATSGPAKGGASGTDPAAAGAQGTASTGTVSAPLGDADWPAVKPFLSGSP